MQLVSVILSLLVCLVSVKCGCAQSSPSVSISLKQYPRCPKTTTFVFGSFNVSPYRFDYAGEGVTFALQNGRQLTTLNVLSHGITGDNPTYVARSPPGRGKSSDDFFVCNSQPSGSITHIMSSQTAPFVTNETFLIPNQLTAHVSVTKQNIVLSANIDGGTVYALAFSRGPYTHFRRDGCRHDWSQRYKTHGLRLVGNYTIDESLATNLSFRQVRPQPHMVLPYGEGVIVPDLGTDLVFYLSISPCGELSEIQRVKLEPGDGPRHAVAHEPTNTLYVVNELSQTVSTLCADGPRSAPLRVCQRFGLLDSGPAENGLAAAIRVSSDFRFLYVSVRRDTLSTPLFGRIAAFSLARNGLIMQKIGESSSGGVHPRDFNVVNSMRVDGECRSYVAVANRDSNNVVFFRRDERSGLVGEAELIYNISTPSSVLPL